MSRNIVTRADVAASPAFKTLADGTPDPAAAPKKEDKYTDKLIKLIPAEIVSVYLGIYTTIKSTSYGADDKQLLQWIVFSLILILTPVYLYKMAGVTKWGQIVCSMFAFVLWAFSFGGPAGDQKVLQHEFTVQFLVSLLLPLYTLIIPMIYGSSSSSTTTES
ncbi:MAG: hypothetical protein IBJ09_05155 [Bacteroidia bacterium]|nr:hypothetical protein [Bacteroidia bacterium]